VTKLPKTDVEVFLEEVVERTLKLEELLELLEKQKDYWKIYIS